MAYTTNLKFDGKLEDGFLVFQPHYISYTILYRIIHYTISYTVPYFFLPLGDVSTTLYHTVDFIFPLLVWPTINFGSHIYGNHHHFMYSTNSKYIYIHMNVKYIHSLGGQAKDDAEKTLSLANLTEVGPKGWFDVVDMLISIRICGSIWVCAYLHVS